MTSMKYIAGNRTYSVNTLKTNQDKYLQITDFDTKVVFWLPNFVISNFTYVFSWDRYREERNNITLKENLLLELDRLQQLSQTPNILKGIEYTQKFILEVNIDLNI